LSQQAPAPEQITLKTVLDRLGSDPKLAVLTNQTLTIYAEVQLIEKVFEMDISLRNITQLNEVLTQVKNVRLQTAYVLTQIRAEIASAQMRSFLNRILQESLRIQVEKYEKALKWIGLEILGDLSGVSNFDTYFNSEVVAIAKDLLMNRFFSMMLDAYEADKLIEDAHQKDPIHLTIDSATKAKIDSYFKDMIVNADLAKKELAKNYYDEVEKIRLDGRELNLLQRVDFELAIDLLNFLSNFVKRYEELFLKLA